MTPPPFPARPSGGDVGPDTEGVPTCQALLDEALKPGSTEPPKSDKPRSPFPTTESMRQKKAQGG